MGYLGDMMNDKDKKGLTRNVLSEIMNTIACCGGDDGELNKIVEDFKKNLEEYNAKLKREAEEKEKKEKEAENKRKEDYVRRVWAECSPVFAYNGNRDKTQEHYVKHIAEVIARYLCDNHPEIFSDTSIEPVIWKKWFESVSNTFLDALTVMLDRNGPANNYSIKVTVEKDKAVSSKRDKVNGTGNIEEAIYRLLNGKYI